MSNVVIVGGNFAGLTAALELKQKLGSEVTVTVIARDDRFLFTPSLIWVPFGWRTPEDVTFPVGPVLEEHGIHFVHAEATLVDPEAHRVDTTAGPFQYDRLLIATGPDVNFGAVPGLGPDANSQSITTLPHALKTADAFRKLMDDPGPAVVGATQGAACFGAAYEFLFNFAHALRKHRMARKVPITFVTAEPFCGHFGMGGLRGGQWMLETFFKQLGIKWITNASMKEILPGEIRLEDGTVLPSKFSMIVPPFLGVEMVRRSGLGDAKGFIPVLPTYQHEKHPDIYAAGVAVAVQAPWVTAVAVGVPKTGFPAEVMAKTAAHNIASTLHGEQPMEKKTFGDIPAICVMDAGNMGVMILSEKMLPPRKHELLIPGPQAHWAKLAFEKYFLWKMQHGYVGLP